MKKLTLSIAAIAAMGTFAIAGGDIAPVEPVVETPVVAPTDAGFYAGIAYSYLTNDTTLTYTNFPGYSEDASTDHNAGMLQLGYKVNKYFAVEGRYWFAASEDDRWVGSDGTSGNLSVDYDAWGIYVKPMYPVTDAFSIYALLGYASNNYDMTQYDLANRPGAISGIDDDGFSWGLGAEYAINSNFSIFFDYTNLYSDDVAIVLQAPVGPNQPGSADVTTETWNFGVTYKF